MPIYEYKCDSCNHTFEKLQRISDKPLQKCCKCGQVTLTKLISPGSFRISGDGVYKPTGKLD